MKVFLAALAALLVVTTPTVAHAYNISWGYETWSDTTPADGQVDEWGRYQVDFVPGTIPGESTGIATIQSPQVWGKVYYGTGQLASNVTSTFRYLFLEAYDIQGDMKVAISGPGDADIYFTVPQMISWAGPTDPRDPSGNVIYNPGQYVMDMSGWAPATDHTDVQMQLVAEGTSFEVRRVFFADDNPLNPIPEPTSLLLLGSGLVGLVGFCRKKK